jgi:hypothetical protein
MKNLNQVIGNFDYEATHAALDKIKNKSYKIGLGVGAASTALLIGKHAITENKKKKRLEAIAKLKEDNQKKSLNKEIMNESIFEKAISKKQKLFDNKVLNAIYNLNEDEYIENKMKNLYFSKQRDTALWQNNLDAATYYENLISII